MDIFSKMEWKLDIDKIALFKFLKAWWERVWVTSGSWWWAGRAGMLQSMGSQRVGHDWSTELTDEKEYVDLYPSPHFRGVLQNIRLGSLGTRFGNYILSWSSESTKNQTKSTKNGMGCNWEVVCHCMSLHCDPMDCSPPGSSVHGIFQARVLEWAAISFSRRSSQPRDWIRVSHIVGRRFTVWATREVLM